MTEYMNEMHFEHRPPRVIQDDEEETDDPVQARHHPKVREFEELLCFEFNTLNGSCRAVNGSVTFDDDTIYDRPDQIGRAHV